MFLLLSVLYFFAHMFQGVDKTWQPYKHEIKLGVLFIDKLKVTLNDPLELAVLITAQLLDLF